MHKMLIGGTLEQGSRTLDVIDPCTGKAFETVPDATQQDVDKAVAAASAAFPAWRDSSPDARANVLEAMAGAIEANIDELADLLIAETGRPRDLAMFELGHLAVGYLRYYASLRLEPELLIEDDTRRVELHRKPLGVVAAIVPWNAPVFIACNKMAPALAAGNTVVVKTAPTTPLTTLRLGELIAEVVPGGVVNILSGGNDAGAHLVSHPDVAKVTFTGSTATGRKIMEACAPSLKRVTLELGGNDAAIVLPGADIATIAPGIFGFSFFNSGQVCAVIKRLYVHDSLYDQMCETLAAIAGSCKVAPGTDAEAQFGPVQNKAQFEKVRGYIEQAKEDGKVVVGGDIQDGPGYFVPLTVIRNVSEGHEIVDEEPFGPVLPVIRYSDVDDAVARANASPFALGGSVWGSDLDQARAVAARLESGSVWINQHCALDPAVPFPANKQSGFGVEGGVEGLYPYLALQTVNMAKPQAA